MRHPDRARLLVGTHDVVELAVDERRLVDVAAPHLQRVAGLGAELVQALRHHLARDQALASALAVALRLRAAHDPPGAVHRRAQRPPRELGVDALSPAGDLSFRSARWPPVASPEVPGPARIAPLCGSSQAAPGFPECPEEDSDLLTPTGRAGPGLTRRLGKSSVTVRGD